MIEEFVTLDRDSLECPSCKGIYLHHESVDVYYRRREDGPSRRTRVKKDDLLVVDDVMNENPSSRRDGLKIKFWCEQCGRHPELVLVQHKGVSQLTWYFDPNEKGTFGLDQGATNLDD